MSRRTARPRKRPFSIRRKRRARTGSGSTSDSTMMSTLCDSAPVKIGSASAALVVAETDEVGERLEAVPVVQAVVAPPATIGQQHEHGVQQQRGQQEQRSARRQPLGSSRRAERGRGAMWSSGHPRTSERAGEMPARSIATDCCGQLAAAASVSAWQRLLGVRRPGEQARRGVVDRRADGRRGRLVEVELDERGLESRRGRPSGSGR